MRRWLLRGFALTFALSVLGWHVVTSAGCEKQQPAPYLPVRMMMPPAASEAGTGATGATPQGAAPSLNQAKAIESAPKKPCKPAYFPATKAAPVFHDDEVPCVDEAPLGQGPAKPGNAK